MAEVLGTLLGTFGVYAYSLGFWAAVFASLLGVWQSVPYLYADFYGVIKKLPVDDAARGDQGDEHAYRLASRSSRSRRCRLHSPAGRW